MDQSKLSLRALEIFEIAARTGSLVKTAAELDCSVSAVSHHLKKLEEHLGVALLEHERRPMTLTPAGANFRRRIAEGLKQIRIGVGETALAEIATVRSLRLGIVDDFNSVVAPQLAVELARHMPNVRLQMRACASHAALDLLTARKLDVAIAAEPSATIEGAIDLPLLRDPFVIAAPLEPHSGTPLNSQSFFSGGAPYPFLRYDSTLLIGRQIDAHLRRRRVTLDDRFEFDSNQSIMAMVASAQGWSVMTALGASSAQRFQNAVRLLPLPGPSFSRRLSVFALADAPAPLVSAIAAILRRMLHADAIAPMLARHPWLDGQLVLLDETPATETEADAVSR